MRSCVSVLHLQLLLGTVRAARARMQDMAPPARTGMYKCACVKMRGPTCARVCMRVNMCTGLSAGFPKRVLRGCGPTPTTKLNATRVAKQGPQQAKARTYKHNLEYMRRSTCDSRPCKLASAATRPLLGSARRNSAAAAWPSQLCRRCCAIKHCAFGHAHGCAREEHSNHHIYVSIVGSSCISVLLQ